MFDFKESSLDAKGPRSDLNHLTTTFFLIYSLMFLFNKLQFKANIQEFRLKYILKVYIK